jgi:putative membrane protein
VNRSAVICFAAGFAILIALVVYVGVQPIVEAAVSLGLSGLALVSIVRLGITGLLGSAWFVVSRGLIGGRPADFAWARLVREAAGEVLPFSQLGGYAAGVRALTLAEVNPLPATLSTFADLIVEFLAKLPYLALGVALLTWLRAPASFAPVLLGLLAGLLILALGLKRLLSRGAILDVLGARVRTRWPALASGSSGEEASTFAKLLSPDWRMGVAILLHFICWMLGGFETWLLFHLMHVQTGLAQAIVIDSLLSTVRTLVFFVPGSVGVQEAFYALLGGLFGIMPAEAIAFSLARRVRDFAIGVPILLIWNVQEARRVWVK